MPKSQSRRFFRNNGLSLAFSAFFLISIGLQSIAGWKTLNEDREMHRETVISYRAYLGNAHFWQAVGENWESEFLQMGVYVFFTAFLFQRGSSESKDPDKEEEVDKEPARIPKQAPLPVRTGGLAYALYRNSLSLAFLLLFLLSFGLHAFAGVRKHNAEAATHGKPAESLGEYTMSADFWFESMQNWQSEFLAVLAMVYLSIYLRQKGSPESKPVFAAHAETGGG